MYTEEQVRQLLEDKGLHFSRMLSFSKSNYLHMYPGNKVYFNANVYTKSHGKIWYGDLDLTKDMARRRNPNTNKLIDNDNTILCKVAKEIGEPIYVLREMDGRFENEGKPIEEQIKKAVWDTETGFATT